MDIHETDGSQRSRQVFGLQRENIFIGSKLEAGYTVTSSFDFSILYIFLCCSKNKKVAIVCGPSRMKLGSQPRKTQVTPSFAHISFKSLRRLCLDSGPALIIRVFITSTGLHVVVATNPAMNEAVKWVVRLSDIPPKSMQKRLKMSYVTSWEVVIRTARAEFGRTPRNKLVAPSERTI